MPTDHELPTRDARHCPRCAALGILPLAQPHEQDGGIVNPVMLCPVCEVEFTATGMTYRGFAVPRDISGMSREERRAWARRMVDAALGELPSDRLPEQ
jgi:hypothetical protein